MADVYKMKVWLDGFENIINRTIDVSSLSSVAKLGYTVMAAFWADGSHLFNIKFGDKRYEIMFDDDYDDEEDLPIDPIKTKLSALKLKEGDVLTMEYDYGADWNFQIKLESISKMKSGTGTHYPYITDGKGRGIIENIFQSDLEKIIEKTNKSGKGVKIASDYGQDEIVWDYRDFDLKNTNALLKGDIMRIKDGYECPDEW